MKICRTCKKEKEDTAFEITTVTAKKTYRHGMCYECRKVVRKVERDLKKIHGKTKPLGTPCDCCGRTDLQLVLDHCHETGKLRGFLCKVCNTSIGALGDNLEGIERARNYLVEAIIWEGKKP